MRFFRYISLLVVCALVSLTALADGGTSFVASSPMIVKKGQIFNIQFTLNAKPEKSSFVPPSFGDFEVIAGPVESTGSSVQIVGTKVSSSHKTTLTYTLIAEEEGRFTVGAASISSGGRKYSTKPQTIEVSGEQVQQQRPQRQQGGGQLAPSAQSVGVNSDDVLLRLLVDKSSVYRGEPVRVTLKRYSRRVDVVGVVDATEPSFDGFWKQELNTSNTAPQRETVNGKLYDSWVLASYLLYPQQAGTFRIEPFTQTVNVQMWVNVGSAEIPELDIFSARCRLTTDPMSINVKELPEPAPASFNGAVGQFTLDAQLPSQSLDANTATSYSVRISGTGNLSFVQAPVVTLPTSFEQYTVKTSESLQPSFKGIQGYRQFEFPIIARAEGNYTLNPVEFTYFNPESANYVTLTSPSMQVTVGPDMGRGGGEAAVVVASGAPSKEDIRLFDQDIRFIKLDRGALRQHGRGIFGSLAYWIVLIVMSVCFAVALIYLRKRIKQMQNTTLIRHKRANKVALQRFRLAEGFMKQEQKQKFYEEMLRGLWGYMCDMLNIPMAILTKESVREDLRKRGVSEELIEQFGATVSLCDEAQYSPMATAQMSEVYEEGVDVVSKMEGAIRNK